MAAALRVYYDADGKTLTAWFDLTPLSQNRPTAGNKPQETRMPPRADN